MKTQDGFTLFDTVAEFETWLNKQNITRTINKLQVHHMDLPNYNTWETTDKRVYGDNRELGRTKSLDSYGKSKWGYSDGHGHYIAQHFNIFPNGKITTGRDLNSTPIGIKGWNTGAICIEIYGDFDKGVDIMTKEQKATVIAVYALLAKRLKIAIDTTHIRPHCWFTAGGTYLGKYDSSRSAKSCPGTNFMGYGVTSTGFNKFLTDVKNYNAPVAPIEPEPNPEPEPKPEVPEFKQYIVRCTTAVLNGRKGPGTNYDIIMEVHKGEAVTIVAEQWVSGVKWQKTKTGYWICSTYTEFVRYV